ncbi:MAG TPA: hypothetical protein VJT69_20650 [Pyrinomonadaceae bacterium]|nr:hypothetical protein [Pyrinomonadaceae bacterium]
MKATTNAATLADAAQKRDTLKAAIAEVEKRYTDYRNIPYEADAHEVGDAAEQVFGDYKRMSTERGQPPDVIFNPPTSGSSWKVALLATLQSASEPLDEQQVSSLSFRRERLSS